MGAEGCGLLPTADDEPAPTELLPSGKNEAIAWVTLQAPALEGCDTGPRSSTERSELTAEAVVFERWSLRGHA